MNKFILGIVMLAMLVAFSAPATAQTACMTDVVTLEQGTITNGTVIAGTGGTINLPPGEVVAVYVHAHTWGNYGGGDYIPNHQLQFVNGDGVVEIINITDCVFNVGGSVSGSRTSGYLPENGTTHLWWKVNATNDSTNTFTIPLSGVVYTKFFVAVINETDEDNRTHQGLWWHNLGLKRVPEPTGTHTTTFSGPANTSANHTLCMAQVMYGSTHPPIHLNGNHVGNVNGPLSCFNVNYGDMIPGGLQTAKWTCAGDGFYALFATLAEKIPLYEPKLEPTDIGFDPETPRPDKAFNVTAMIENTGDAASELDNATLYVWNITDAVEVWNGNETIKVLAPGANTTLNFTNVSLNLSEGCYEFKVVVESCSNEKKVNHTVGYIIVVESDSDFERLNNTPGGVGDSPLPAGCFAHESDGSYTIKNLTITNCAGDGISITGTTKNFVIKNCTIHDCAPDDSGVFLNNVTRGTVTECTLHNNTAYGVELGLVPLNADPIPGGGQPSDPKNVNITCNEIYQNGMSTNKNGIDLIGFDCTVKCNNVRDNGEYGIYVFGNDSKIYNNTIKNNGDYGISLYNSSGNVIYRNDLIDNNGTGVQASDTWKHHGWNFNHWNSTTMVSYCYKNKTQSRLNYTGNHWDNHITPDANDDGIVDDPYAIDGGAGAVDSYPMLIKWWNCGDVDCSGGIPGASDRFAILDWEFCDCWAADVDCSGGIPGALDGFEILDNPSNLNCCICRHEEAPPCPQCNC